MGQTMQKAQKMQKSKTQKFFWLASTSLVIAISMLAQMASAQMEFSGYMRSGTGTNSLGGQYKSFSGNPLRLGNEVGNYGELSFTYWSQKPKDLDPYFKSVMTMAYYSSNNSQYENAYPQVIETYIEGGYVDSLPFTTWVGKRFYREGDVHIFDLRPYADMNGTGGGLGKIDLGFGKLDVAYIQQNKNPEGASSIGNPNKEALDMRIHGMAGGALDAWLASASISNGDLGPSYTGLALGFKYSSTIADGNNSVVVAYGSGAMQDLGMSMGYSGATEDVKKQNRTRIVEDFSKEISPKVGILASAKYETSSDVIAAGKTTTEYALGVRPIYYFSDQIQWVFEGGTASYTNSNTNKTATVTRLTTGPQLSFKHSIWSRPVIRAFVTNTSWNEDYKTTTLASDTAFKDKTSATQIGVQGEVWF